MPDNVKNRVFCPLNEQVDVCKQVFKKLENDQLVERQVITCGFWSESAGRCAIGLLAEGLKQINEKADRIASAAGASTRSWTRRTLLMIDRRVSEVMARSSDIRLTWGRAQAGMDLAEMNAKSGGRWSWGRLRAVEALKR